MKTNRNIEIYSNNSDSATTSIGFIALTIASPVMGLVLLVPAIPQIVTNFSISENVGQCLITFYLIALGLGQLVFGITSDRFGRRPILLIGSLIFAIGSSLTLISNTIEALLACRVVQGLGAAACLSMGRAMINDNFVRAEAAKHMSTAQTIQSLVPIISVLFGGILVEFLGWKSGMAASSIAGFIIFFITLHKIKETHKYRLSKINIIEVSKAYGVILTNLTFLSFAITCGMQSGMFYVLAGILPYHYEALGQSALAFGLWFSIMPVGFFIGNLINRRYLVMRGIEIVAFAGSFITLTSMIILLVASYTDNLSPIAIALPCGLFGFGNGILISNATIGAISAAGKYAGTGSGFTGAWQMIAGASFGVLIVAIGGADNMLVAVSSVIGISIISIICLSYAFIYRHKSLDNLNIKTKKLDRDRSF